MGAQAFSWRLTEWESTGDRKFSLAATISLGRKLEFSNFRNRSQFVVSQEPPRPLRRPTLLLQRS
jgi:hypothetical protein